MGMTVARIMMVVVDNPPPLLSPLSLLPPLVVIEKVLTAMFPTVPLESRLLILFCALTALLDPGGKLEVIRVRILIDPEEILSTTMFCTPTPAAFAI